MPFTAPLLHSGGSPYSAAIHFDPNLGTGSVGGIYINNSTITVLSDKDDYFKPQVNALNEDYLPFKVFQEYKFTLIRNTLVDGSSNQNIKYVRLVEMEITSVNSPDTNIMEVYNDTNGALTPSPVTYTPIDAPFPFLDGFGIEVFVSGGQRSLSGSILVGIQAT
jgi:hypothetical protein